MGMYDHLFKKMQEAKSLHTWAEQLPIGEHALTLLRYQGKESEKEDGTIVEAEFEVIESTTLEPGAIAGWAWWPMAKGFRGAYSLMRGKEFVAACAECVGDDRPVTDAGASLISDAQPGRGLTIVANVVRGKPHKTLPGEFYTEVTWSAVPQTLAEIAEKRKDLDVRIPLPVPEAPAAGRAPVKTGGILGNYRKG